MAPELHLFDVISPILFAPVFIGAFSLVREPMRQKVNAILVAGAGAAYFSSGLGAWELVFTTLATIVAYQGLRSYPFIGLAWLMHSAWDLVHHFYADPILLFAPTSSFGCFIFDALIAIWFFFGAPSPRRGEGRGEGPLRSNAEPPNH